VADAKEVEVENPAEATCYHRTLIFCLTVRRLTLTFPCYLLNVSGQKRYPKGEALISSKDF